MRKIGTTIRMASRDRIVQFVCLAFVGSQIAGNQIHARQEFRRGRGGKRSKLAREERQVRLVAIGGRSQHQVLEGTAHPDVFFSQVGIECPDISLGVDVQLNRGIRHFEEPRLRIVRARRQNRGAHQREGSVPVGRTFAPVFPGFVGRSLADAEDALIVGAPDSSACNYDGNNSGAFQE